MAKDKRYSTLKVMLDTGNLKSFSEVFDIIPKSVVASDLGINYTRFLVKLENLEDFTLREILKLSLQMEVEALAIITLLLKDMEGLNKSKKGLPKKG